MFFPFSRIIALLMAGVLCALLATMAITRHVAVLAIFVVAVFIAYLAGNIVLWQRMRRGQ